MDTSESGATAVSETEAPPAPAPQKLRVNEWYQRRRSNKPAPTTQPPTPGAWTVIAVIVLALLVGLIVIVGLRTSLGALRDAALAAHIESDAASLYWIGVDGLIVVAIIAALVLRHDPAARRYCLAVIGVFTIASGLLQYLHGLGWFTPDPVSRLMPRLPWGVVLVIACLVIGTIFCGTHLFVHALRRLFPGTPSEQGEATANNPYQATAALDGDAPENHPSQGATRTADEEREERKQWAGITVRILLDNNIPPPRKRLAADYGISARQVGYVIADVELEKEAAANKLDHESDEEPTLREASATTKPTNGSPVTSGLIRTGGAP